MCEVNVTQAHHLHLVTTRAISKIWVNLGKLNSSYVADKLSALEALNVTE